MYVEYEKDPEAIYRLSFERVRTALGQDLSHYPEDIQNFIVRIAHACGMGDILHDMDIAPNMMACAKAAILRGAPIFCDCEMVASGITRKFLHDNRIIVTLNHPSVPELSKQIATTRSAAAVQLWGEEIAGAIIAIGNAPTALFYLLELIASGTLPKPAVILGFPVGFVGAAESKLALSQSNLNYACLHGTRGGSAMAAAAVNALLLLAGKKGA